MNMNWYEWNQARIDRHDAPGVDEKHERASISRGKEVPAAGSVMPAYRPAVERVRRLDGQDLGEHDYRRLVAHRARKILREVVPLFTGDDERRAAEKAAVGQLEKVHQEPNFLPASFLELGARRARAVCRIPFRTDEGRFVGSGFLVAPGILMTNHHVLESEDVARTAVAEFDYEVGKVQRRVALHPEELFYTYPELDFTLVACDTDALDDVEPIPLRRNALEIMRNERVNIIQHPAGRPKEVVLHDNKVTRVLDTMIYYHADTEGGSSGSPVFDNEWNLVGLHHWGQNFPDGSADNRAIRIPAILAHLQAVVAGGGYRNGRLRTVLNGAEGTNPLLGFFDVAGVVDVVDVANASHEIEVPQWQGSRDFVDVGFWNIEHFNDNVSGDRIDRVADVVAGLNLDCFGLVEVQEGALQALIQELSHRGIDADYVLENTPYAQDLAVLYDRDTTTARRDTDIVNRYRPILDRQITHGTVFPRDPLFARCSVRQDDQGATTDFLMIVVHLKAYTDDVPSRERRRAAALALREIIDDIRQREPDLPVVIGGDFNEFLTNDVLAGLTSSPDLFALTADDAQDGAASYIGGSLRSLIDHIIVSNDVNIADIQGDDAAIVRLDRSAADFDDTVSDHVPLVFRMVFAGGGVDGGGGTRSRSRVTIPEEAAQLQLVFVDEHGQTIPGGGTELFRLAPGRAGFEE